MKSDKFLGSVLGSFFLILYGTFLLCSSYISFSNIKVFISLFFLFYGLFHLLAYLIDTKEKEYSNLWLVFIGLVLAILSFYWIDFSISKSFAFLILGFSFFVSIVKLKKADYFHDRKSKFWMFVVSELLLFLLFSILTSLHFFYEESVLIIVLGFYVFGVGIFEFFESFILLLTKGKLK